MTSNRSWRLGPGLREVRRGGPCKQRVINVCDEPKLGLRE